MPPSDRRHGRAAPTAPAPAELVVTAEFEAALAHLHSGGDLFLTGKAGTGKSTLIRHFLDRTSRRTIVAAPTGIAALNVGGYTVHRLFSFPPGVDEHHVRSADYRPHRFADALAQLDTLIIDEASMMRADLFDALAAALERFGPRPDEPLGGVQLVLVGDLYQLPPVVTEAEQAWIEQRYDTPFFFSARSFHADRFPVFELTSVFRQRGDEGLARLLNAVRDGRLLDDARAELNRRADPKFEPGPGEFWLTLAPTKRVVAARNAERLARLTDTVQRYTAAMTGQTDGFEPPTDEVLDLAVGAQIMMVTNDPLDRWVNGTLGEIISIGADDDGPKLTVALRGGGAATVRPHTWEITRPTARDGRMIHEQVGTFTQFPLTLAWAITIHKAQGQTLDRVIVDLTGGTFAGGQLYVALSRATSLDGLVLTREVLPRDLRGDLRVRRYLAAGRAPAKADERAYLAVLTVGGTGRHRRPRPVEIAVVTDDGAEASTVINPTSDLYSAATDFRLTARDVALAPLLTEAWPVLGALLAGRVPVGVDVDTALGHVDAELKRNQVVEQVPLGIDLTAAVLVGDERAALSAPTALARARAVRAAADRLRRTGDLPAGGDAFPEAARGHGYLLARTTGPDADAGWAGFTVGGDLSVEDDSAAVLAGLLRTAWARVVGPDAETVERLRAVEARLNMTILPADLEVTGPPRPDQVLVPGARICFSGTVQHPVRGVMDKEQLHDLAEARGLVPAANLTKSKTDVLVVAEAGSQSAKAKSAARWGKPVLTAEEFFDWTERG